MPESSFTFSGSSNIAYQHVLNRSVAGTRLSPRLWNLTRQNQKNVNDVLMGSVRIGRSVTGAGKELLQIGPDNLFNDQGLINVKVPKYVRELESAAREARRLSDSSVLQKTVAKYRHYINNLTRAGEPEYQHLGIRGASRMLVKRLASDTDEVYEAAVDKWVKRKASYHARVVARNETNEAHWNAILEENKDKPYIAGFLWNLGAHPEPDICDSLQGKVYTKEQLDSLAAEWGGNRRPHPNCNCWLSEQVDKSYFDNYTPSKELMKQVQEDPRFPEFRSWATGWLERMGAEVPAKLSAMPALISMSLDELRRTARELGIKNTSRMSRKELIREIERVSQ